MAPLKYEVGANVLDVTSEASETGDPIITLIILHGEKTHYSFFFFISLRLFFSENKQLNSKWRELLDTRVEIEGNADSTSLCHVILAKQ